MPSISCIVEGHGEVKALPVLLRRIASARCPETYVEVQTPIRVHRDRFLNRADEFSRHLELAGGKCGDGGWVLILLDADDDCPATLGRELLARAQDVLPDRSVSVVLAKREFEAWFIGAARSLRGQRGLTVTDDDLEIEPERPRDAKGWLRDRMAAGTYGETTDQPAFAARMDLQEALLRCRSFRKLWDEWGKQPSLNEN